MANTVALVTGKGYRVVEEVPVAQEWNFQKQEWESSSVVLRAANILRFIRSTSIEKTQMLIFATPVGQVRRFAIEAKYAEKFVAFSS